MCDQELDYRHSQHEYIESSNNNYYSHEEIYEEEKMEMPNMLDSSFGVTQYNKPNSQRYEMN
jgi:hypothetical protein